jgi:hypothetical protein
VTNVTNREGDGVSVVTLYGRIVFGEGKRIEEDGPVHPTGPGLRGFCGQDGGLEAGAV